MQMDELDKAILEMVQVEVPVVKRPFKTIGEKLGVSEEDILSRLIDLAESGIIRKIGGVLDPRQLGYESILLAAKVPKDKIEDAAKLVGRYEGVTHCYLRDHEFNLWFTLIERNEDRFNDALEAIRKNLPYELLELKASKTFKIGVKFDIKN